MTNLELQNLKIGDRVGCYRNHSQHRILLEYGFGTITKINRNGQITISLGEETFNKVFDKYGNEKNRGDFLGASLCSAEWLEKQLVEQAVGIRIVNEGLSTSSAT